MTIPLLSPHEAIQINLRIEQWADDACHWTTVNNTETKFLKNQGNHHEPLIVEGVSATLYCQALQGNDPKFGLFIFDDAGLGTRIGGLHVGAEFLADAPSGSSEPSFHYVVGVCGSRDQFLNGGVSPRDAKLTLIHELSHFVDATEFKIASTYGHREALSGAQAYEASAVEIRAKLQEGIYLLRAKPELLKKYLAMNEGDEGRLAYGWHHLAGTVHSDDLRHILLPYCNEIATQLASNSPQIT